MEFMKSDGIAFAVDRDAGKMFRMDGPKSFVEIPFSSAIDLRSVPISEAKALEIVKGWESESDAS